MFELTTEEFNDLRSQFGTSSWGGARYVPMAFSELCKGLLLSSVLNYKVAKQDEKIALVFQYLKTFIDVQKTPMKRVGYKRKDEQ